MLRHIEVKTMDDFDLPVTTVRDVFKSNAKELLRCLKRDNYPGSFLTLSLEEFDVKVPLELVTQFVVEEALA